MLEMRFTPSKCKTLLQASIASEPNFVIADQLDEFNRLLFGQLHLTWRSSTRSILTHTESPFGFINSRHLWRLRNIR